MCARGEPLGVAVGMARRHSRALSGLPAVVSPMVASPDQERLPDSPEWTYVYKYEFCTLFGPVVLGVTRSGGRRHLSASIWLPVLRVGAAE